MEHVGKGNHTIEWESVTFPTRDTAWTARGVKEAVEIRKTVAQVMNRDGGCHQLPLLYSMLLVKMMSPFYHKWHSMSDLTMLIDIIWRN